MKIADLQGKKLAELKDIARNMNLTGFSTLRKQDLIYLIIEAQAEAVAGTGNGAPRKSRTRSKTSKEATPAPEAPTRPDARAAELASETETSNAQAHYITVGLSFKHQ